MTQSVTKWMKSNEPPAWFGAIDRVHRSTSFEPKPWWKLWWMDSKLRKIPRRLTCAALDHDYVRHASVINDTIHCDRCGKFLRTRIKHWRW